jgi:hypothetical protein
MRMEKKAHLEMMDSDLYNGRQSEIKLPAIMIKLL